MTDPYWAGDKTGRDPGEELNALRRAVAETLGEDPETWPTHGNAPLAIASAVALRASKKIKYVYVIGPYSKGDPVRNVRNAIDAGEALRALGYVPFIPHLYHFWHLVYPHDINFWYTLDNEWIERCDAALRLPGQSPGGDDEEQRFKAQGKPVRRSLRDFGDRSNG
jgi:hypothetical protein